MINVDYWLGSILVFSYFAAAWHRGSLVRASILWVCLWVGAGRLAFLTEQGYIRFLASDVYRLNYGKQEEPWVLVLVLCSAGVIFLVAAPVVWFYRAWRNRYEIALSLVLHNDDVSQ
jgi:uncharacterized PurR-regulated membrane protein YhhQ (DUF165 family)